MKLNAPQKRKIIWLLLAVCVGGLVGGLYFPPILIISGLSILGIGETFFSFDTELSEKITKYETPVDLQALINDSFPKENELQRLIPPNKNEKENKEKVANEIYAQHVFFSDLQPKRDDKEGDRCDLSVAPKL